VHYGHGTDLSGYVSEVLIGVDRDNLVPVEFLESTQSEIYGNLEFDGVLGLGIFVPSRVMYKDFEVELFKNTVIDGLEEIGKIGSRVFSVSYSGDPKLTIGDWDRSIAALEEDLHWYPFIRSYTVDFEYLSMGGRDVMFSMNAAMDTSSKFIELPIPAIDFIIWSLNNIVGVNCSRVDIQPLECEISSIDIIPTLPSLIFQIGAVQYPVYSHSYMAKCLDKNNREIKNAGLKCMLAIVPTTFSPILGSPFFHKNFVVFDPDNKRIGMKSLIDSE